MAGTPLILAIQDFHEPGSLYASGASLWQYLYGIRSRWFTDDRGQLHIEEVPVSAHKDRDKEIPSGFFSLPGAEHISAVIFGNTGTVAKFNRLGYLNDHGRDADLVMIRRGVCYDHTHSDVPAAFSYTVGEPDAPVEAWGQGLSVYHNPNAVTPLPLKLLPLAYHYHDGETLQSLVPDFHPFSSQTVIIAPRPTVE